MDNKNFGELEYKGFILTLQQDPYLDGTFDKPVYRASAKCEHDCDYMVEWDVITDSDDESDCCDWDDFRVREA